MQNKLWKHFVIGLLLLGLVGGALYTTHLAAAGEWATPKAAILSEEVYVPAGEFLMGCSTDTTSPVTCDGDAQPIHAVYLDAFYIDKTEVTNAHYVACVAAGACSPPLDETPKHPSIYTDPALANHPVVYIDRQRAGKYCEWAGRRLPTEAEWEKAARGTDRRLFPWGNALPTCELANHAFIYFDGYGQRQRHCVGGTTPVGSYPQGVSPYGALDMMGNVREWVSDLYLRRYYSESPYYNPQGATVSDKGSPVRGGSWDENYNHANAWVRIDEADVLQVELIGFRCARTDVAGSPTPTITPSPTHTSSPTPSPTPTSTPTPYAAVDIGPEGGAVWLANAMHLTLLEIRRDALDATGRVTLTYSRQDNMQGDLQGINHFFKLDADLHGSQSWIPPYFPQPLRLTLGFHDSAVIPGTVQLYRLAEQGWITDGISMSLQGKGYAVADVLWTGVYGLMGQSNRLYLPVVVKR